MSFAPFLQYTVRRCFLFGVAFSLAGFREYPYWVQLALCALAIAAFLPLSVRKYKRISL